MNSAAAARKACASTTARTVWPEEPWRFTAGWDRHFLHSMVEQKQRADPIPMLELTRLSKSYPTPRGPLEVLSDVSLSLAPGDAAAIMGPSGSGKSSLLYILGALEPPTSGTVALDGKNPFAFDRTALAAFRNEQIGFVFQDHCLLPQCTVVENVLIPTLVATTANDDEK